MLEIRNAKTHSERINAAEGALDANLIREIIIDQSKRAGVGHIGSALSVADIVACLYGSILRIPGIKDPERDRFILSKGHAALALYAALHLRGILSQEELNTFCGDGSALGVHPELVCPGVDFATGSLGQGLSFAVGAALAARCQGSARRAFALLSDAECNEGSVWEAVMFAAHHKLDNLIVIVDLNQQQAFGYTRDIIDLSPLADRFQAFNWDVHEVDGHDVGQMTKLISSFENQSSTCQTAPHVLLAHTTFGKGVSFMEHQIKWHYSPLSDSEYAQAKSELRRNSA